MHVPFAEKGQVGESTVTAIGLHLPNRPLEPGEIERIAGLGVRVFVDLHWFASRWPAIRAAIPGAIIHGRIDIRGPLGNPLTEAAQCAEIIRAQGANTWRARNEPELEGVSQHSDWYTWLLAFGSEIKRLCPDQRIYAPAMSPGTPDWVTWLIATADAAKASGLDGCDCHIYGSPAECDVTLNVVRAVWQGALVCSETNFGAGRPYDLQRWADELPGVMQTMEQHGVEAACEFIWFWQGADTPLPTLVDVRDSPMEDAIRRLATMALKDQYPAQFAAWEKAGGVDDNFLPYLLATGAKAPTAADVPVLLGNARAKINELELVIGKLLPN